MDKPTMKVCKGCAVTKPLDEFYAHPCTADKRNGKCKDCVKKRVSERYFERRAEGKVRWS